MASPGFRNVFEPQAERPKHDASSAGLALIKDSFRLHTLLLLGALFQTILSLLLPPRYALLPMTLLLLHALLTTIIELLSPKAWSNHGPGANLIPYKISAQIPNPSYNPQSESPSSIFSSTPADKGIVVLHLGIRFNHPLGVAGPDASKMGDLNDACNKRVLSHIDSPDSKDDFGCLGFSSWQSVDERESKNTMMSVYYFRDMDGLNRFAHDDVHRQAWDYYVREFGGETGKGKRHVGVFHEAFYAPPGMWETIYMNMQPTMLGRAFAPVRNEQTGRTEWVGTLVDARNKGLRSQWARMGRSVGDRYPSQGYEDGKAQDGV